MNSTNLEQITLYLQQNYSQPLRIWAYSDWCGNFIVMVILTLSMLYFIRQEWEYEDLQVGKIIGGALALILLVVITAFIPYTLHVFTTPEISAIKDLLKK